MTQDDQSLGNENTLLGGNTEASQLDEPSASKGEST
jgi:hypothetical protein